MPKRIQLSGLSINRALHDLIAKEITPGSGVEAAGIVADLGGQEPRLAGKTRLVAEENKRLTLGSSGAAGDDGV
ncbi:hypothetical protein [Candidatus Spongiihabitans sp.]|uniref:hypothetical protein n=1 Tax=Candidatus Spongiihabitans sp. TaxID=3101308 RepID=UPI003C6EB907